MSEKINKIQIKGVGYVVPTFVIQNSKQNIEPKNIQINAYEIAGSYAGNIKIDNEKMFLMGNKLDEDKCKFFIYNYRGKNYSFVYDGKQKDLNFGLLLNKIERDEKTKDIVLTETVTFVGKSELTKEEVTYNEYLDNDMGLDIVSSGKSKANFNQFISYADRLTQDGKALKASYDFTVNNNLDFDYFKYIENEEPVEIINLLIKSMSKVANYILEITNKDPERADLTNTELDTIYNIIGDEVYKLDVNHSSSFYQFMHELFSEVFTNAIDVKRAPALLLAFVLNNNPNLNHYIVEKPEQLIAFDILSIDSINYENIINIIKPYINLDLIEGVNKLDEALVDNLDYDIDNIIDVYSFIKRISENKDIYKVLKDIELACEEYSQTLDFTDKFDLDETTLVS